MAIDMLDGRQIYTCPITGNKFFMPGFDPREFSTAEALNPFNDGEVA
jgi:hypothetical protein